ncbi:MAG: hypothetical protein EZS28_013811 [Streblomastix strix]|uniref:Uncharacterized protein n=1 Tax=Streblomastix strix TaxID=222440 RepID=A0A5J4W6U8_9EUKA|nr:MAG: hypothetical protein EZS28_013811 [Streblomastix strix]
MHQDKFNIQPGEALIIGDNKENIKLSQKRKQEGREFYDYLPVSCLSFLCYIRKSSGLRVHRVFTLFSRCLSHISTVSLKSLRQVLRDIDFKGINKIIWWSDGAPHFHSIQLAFALIDDQIRFKVGVDFIANYF